MHMKSLSSGKWRRAARKQQVFAACFILPFLFMLGLQSIDEDRSDRFV
jgi:hypothetical protein